MTARHAIHLRCAIPGFALSAQAEWRSDAAALFGPSGSGKSTILEAIAGVRHDVEGDVRLCGRALHGLPARDRRIGWVPQDGALFPHLRVRENLELASRARGDAGAIARAVDALEIDSLLDRRARELSGGERQRVAIARALASRPDFLLLDEPLAAIDRPLRTRIVPFLQRLRKDLAIPFLLVTHDPLEVMELVDEVLVLSSGDIAAQGPPASIFASASEFAPLHALGAENVYDIECVESGVVEEARTDRPGSASSLVVRTRGGLELTLAHVPGFPIPTRVALRAEDVLLAAEVPRAISAQNVIAARVAAVTEVRGARLVELAVGSSGERMLAKITAAAERRLAIVPGADVCVVLKAHAVHPL